MAKQTRPKGEPWPVDRRWKEWILGLMAKERVTHPDLARLVGVTASSIYQLLDPAGKVRTSRLVPQIHKALKQQPPSRETLPTGRAHDERKHELDELWPHLEEADREILLNLARRAREKS